MQNNIQLNASDETLIEKFNSLTNRASVADMLEIDEERLNYYLYILPEQERYTPFEIPKKSGDGVRKIFAPNDSLKVLQQKLNYVLQLVYKPKVSVHGFVSKATGETRNIVTNAKVHSRKRFVFNLDIKDFFPSINFGRVRGMLMARPYNIPAEAATILAQVICYRNQLPQGAPTSPVISNMICSKLDDELLHFARKYSCLYTRYADDITFSTNERDFPTDVAHFLSNGSLRVGNKLKDLIENNGFRINESKVRLQKEYQRQVVTGLIVNRPPIVPNRSSTSPNVNRRFIAQIRAMLYAWDKYKYNDAAKEYSEKYAKKYRGEPPYNKNNHAEFAKVVRGKIDFLGQVRGRDNWMYIKFLNQFNTLMYGEIEDAVWILEAIFDSEDDVNIIQGTGFLLSGYGLITCWHVFHENIQAYHPSNPQQKYDVTLLAHDAELDIAILSLDIPKKRALNCANPSSVVNVGDRITLLGFPQHADRRTITKREGQIIRLEQRTDKNGRWLNFIVISEPIISGNSGGPILDVNNCVIGIATKGINQNTKDEMQDLDFHAVVPISYLGELKRDVAP